MSRVILLDAGGVLFENVIEHSPFLTVLARRFGVDEGALRERYEEQDEEFESGRRTGAAAVTFALESLGVSRSAISRSTLLSIYGRHVQPNHELLEFLRLRRESASDRRYHLTLANNEARDWDAEKHRRFGHLTLCDSLSCSWLLGVAKPDPRFFLVGLARLRAKPSESTLIDDNRDCLTAAEALGLFAYEYHGNADLFAMLDHI
jgi:putative hydrolase of the HAD superfamily